MNLDFEARLRAQVDFPSPSRVAGEVIALARDPEIELAKVAQAMSRDPAMTAKLLRIANSAFYAQRRPSQNIRQALVIIGLNGALTLALSFSLVSTLRGCKPNGIDYKQFWRRTLLAATASRAFGEIVCKGQDEDIFLAGLLQDVAVLAIDRSVRDFYEKLPRGATHAELVAYERELLKGKDHAAYGAMLLKTWNLPEKLCVAVEHSHSSESLPADSEQGKFARCIALGSDLAEATLSSERSAALARIAQRSNKLLALRDEQFTAVVARVLKLIPEAEELYETSILEAADAENMLAQARELLTVRNLHALREVHALQDTAAVLLSRTEQLEETSRRDALTETLNRSWTDRLLEREHTQAVMFSRSLSVAFVDLDHFKKINERHGHENGNVVLKACAQTIQSSVRGSDLVGRYAGDKFLVLLPGTDMHMAANVCERILLNVRNLQIPLNDGPLKATVTIGVATYTPQHRFTNAMELIEAADHALYAAKLRGRNCVEYFENISQTARHTHLNRA